jgi:hypothetical protein
MAEMPKTTDVQEAMKKQIGELRREMNKINRQLADRAGELSEEASGWYEGASERATRAAGQLRAGAQTVSETVQQNPGTISSALVLGGIIGFAVGFLAGQVNGDNNRRWY